MVVKNRKYAEWAQTELEHLIISYSVYTKYLPPEAQILARFVIWPAVSKISHFL